MPLTHLQMVGVPTLEPHRATQPLTPATADTGSMGVRVEHVCLQAFGQRVSLLVQVSELLQKKFDTLCKMFQILFYLLNCHYMDQ